MKKVKLVKLNIKSEKAFTMQDLVIALVIIMLFVGIIGSTMYLAFKNNAKTNLTSQMTFYAVQIIEDIDKISYEEAITKTGNDYKSQFQIPDGYMVEVSFSNYGEGIENVQDVIKRVDVKLSYTIAGDTVDYSIEKLKIKEI